VQNSPLHIAVKKLAGDIPDAYSYIFDSQDRRFIYFSKPNPALEAEIEELDREKGLANLVEQSLDNIVEIPCKRDERVFFIKRMASNLYFGICVLKHAKSIQEGKKVMTSAFHVQSE